MEDEIKSSDVSNVNILWHSQSTFAWHQTCVSGKYSFWIGVTLWSLYRAEQESLQQVQRETCPPPSCEGRVGAVRLLRGDVDLLAVVANMWPEPCCVSDRERNRTLLLYLDCIISNVPGRSIPLFLLDLVQCQNVREGTNETGTLNHIHATVKIGQRRECGALAGMSVVDPHEVDGSHVVKARWADQDKDRTVT